MEKHEKQQLKTLLITIREANRTLFKFMKQFEDELAKFMGEDADELIEFEEEITDEGDKDIHKQKEPGEHR